MPTFSHVSRLPVPAERTFAWHHRPDALRRLTPPRPRVTVVEAPASLAPGTRAVLDLHLGPLRLRWVAEHVAYEHRGAEGGTFVDEQRAGPFRRWRHEHIVSADGRQGSLLHDRVEWDVPFLPGWLVRPFVHWRLRALFRWRHRATAAALGAALEDA